MNEFNWLVAEQRVREALHLAEGPLYLQPQRRHRSVKRSLAATLVRLGLRLDAGAGEGLGALDLSPAGSGGRRS